MVSEVKFLRHQKGNLMCKSNSLPFLQIPPIALMLWPSTSCSMTLILRLIPARFSEVSHSGMVFTLILLFMLNSNFWLCFILIFYVYNLKFHIIYEIQFILYLQSLLLLLLILPLWVCFILSRWRCFSLIGINCFHCFSLFSRYLWVRPLIGFSDWIGSNFLNDRIIAIYHNCFSLGKMVSFHRHCCWLLYFEDFLWLLPMDKCEHSLVSLITL